MVAQATNDFWTGASTPSDSCSGIFPQPPIFLHQQLLVNPPLSNGSTWFNHHGFSRWNSSHPPVFPWVFSISGAQNGLGSSGTLPHLRWKLLLRQASQQGIGATQQDLRWCRELDEFEGIETTVKTIIYIYSCGYILAVNQAPGCICIVNKGYITYTYYIYMNVFIYLHIYIYICIYIYRDR